jgi:hypothetical protein
MEARQEKMEICHGKMDTATNTLQERIETTRPTRNKYQPKGKPAKKKKVVIHSIRSELEHEESGGRLLASRPTDPEPPPGTQ